MPFRMMFLCVFVLTILIVFSGCKGGDDSDGAVDFNSTKKKTSAFINKVMEENNLPGMSIALVNGNDVVWTEGFGYADRENKVPARADTVYMLGSISKTLTAVAVLQLLDQGNIADLTDPLADYLPGFEMKERYANQRNEITIKRVLNHHSGIPGDLFNAMFVTRNWNHWQVGLYQDWLLNYLQGDYPSHRPGEVASYSNTAYTLAGMMVAHLSVEETFNAHMREALFEPLGMDDTSFRQIDENLAKGYLNGNAVYPETEVNMAPTGGAYTTAEDMAQFMKMLLEEGRITGRPRILEPDTVELMGEAEETPLDMESIFQPGLGLDSVDDPVMRYAGPAWTKDGATNNFTTFMELLPNRNLGAIVLSNSRSAANANYAVVRECLRNAVKEKYGLEPSMPAMPDYDSLSEAWQIEGMYVRARQGGYDRIVDNATSGLTWVQNAQSSNPESVQLSYNASCGMYEVQDAGFRLVFQEKEWQNKTRTLMLQYGAPKGGKHYQTNGYLVHCLGSEVQQVDIPQEWDARVNERYIIENIGWNDIYTWFATYFEFREKDGMLQLSGHASQTLFPQNGTVAFTRGLFNQRGDSSVRIIEEDGREKVVYGGYKAYNIEQVPSINVGDTVSGTSQAPHNAWYELDVSSEQTLEASISGMDSEKYTLRVMARDLQAPVAQGKGSLSWDAGPNTWYVAVCPHPDAPQDFQLSITSQN